MDDADTQLIAKKPRAAWFYRLFRGPTPQELLLKQLRDAEIDLLHARQAAEYYAAHSNMLNTRVARLRNLAAGN